MRSRLFPALLFLGGTLLVAAGSPQQHNDERRKQQRAVQQEEMESYYKKWLEQDVVYIITEEESDVFQQLSNDDERDAFIEQFWRRRDTDLTTADNEFKIEHYRRIAYANDKFTAGIPGWKSDRGRIYIAYGPPDRLESMPAGGSYERTRKEGGGSTSVFPFEVWEYRHIPGIGDDIVLEFVDDEGGGLYELTWDEHRKDELLYSGGMGATWDEMEPNLGGVTDHTSKQFRVARRRFAGDQAGPYRFAGYFETERDKPFSELILSSQLNSAPQVKFEDLERVVNSAIYYDMIGFDLDTATFHTGPEQALVTVTVQIPNRSLNFKDLGGDILQAKAEVLGRVEDLGGQIHTVFEEGVAREIPASQRIRTTVGASVFQKQMLLPAGLYKLTLVVKDTETGQLGTSVRRIDVPRYAEEELAVSSLVLAQEIGAAQDADSGQFRLGSLKVLPRVTGQFRKDEDLGFYFQVYNTALDQTSNLPDLKVEFAIADRGTTPSFWRDCSRVASLAGSYLTVARLTSLLRYEPGQYTLHIRVTDQISQQSVTRSTDFSILKPRAE